MLRVFLLSNLIQADIPTNSRQWPVTCRWAPNTASEVIIDPTYVCFGISLKTTYRSFCDINIWIQLVSQVINDCENTHTWFICCVALRTCVICNLSYSVSYIVFIQSVCTFALFHHVWRVIRDTNCDGANYSYFQKYSTAGLKASSKQVK